MKLDIITLHCAYNCGSVLQGFALCKYLNDTYSDVSAKLIDYEPKYMETEGRGLRTAARKILYRKHYQSRVRNFRKFISENDKLTPQKYRSYKELEKDPPKADIYIVGSDQLWNPVFNCGRDPAFFLKFVTKGKKMAISTSLGSDLLTAEQLKAIAENIKDFSYVSVREPVSVQQLKEAGVRQVECLCDPTLLLPKETYDGLAKDYKDLGKYVAVYLTVHSELLDDILSKLRAEGYKIVGVGGYIKKFDCDVHIQDAGPAEFLGLIRDASYVVATSFHATVFSLLFRKKFLIIPPSINNTRIEQLLGVVDLKDHIVTKKEDAGVLTREIDYERVQEALNQFITESKQRLDKALHHEFEGIADK